MSNDPKNVILGTGQFKLSTALPVTDPNLSASYSIDFGNQSLVMKIGGETKPHFGSKLGKLIRDKVFRTKSTLDYEATLDELSPAVIAYIMGSPSGNAPDPGKIFSGYGWIGVDGNGEPIIPAEDKAIFVHHSFRCDCFIEGDLNFDPENFAEVKMMVMVDLNTPGQTLFTDRVIE